MKKIILTSTFIYAFFFTAQLRAQVPGDLHYYLLTYITVQECNSEGTPVGSAQTIPSGTKFTISGFTENDFIIRLWMWDTTGYADVSSQLSLNKILTKPQNAIRNNFKNYSTLNVQPNTTNGTNILRYFILPKGYLDVFARKIVAKWNATYGVALLPFKLRPSKGDFSKDLSISNMGGCKRRLNLEGTSSISILFGMGITSVSLDSVNTESKVTKAEDRAAITLSVGLVYEYERLQIGLFTGWDWLSRNSVSNWGYQGKEWLALGLGFSIFSDTKATKEEGKQTD